METVVEPKIVQYPAPTPLDGDIITTFKNDRLASEMTGENWTIEMPAQK